MAENLYFPPVNVPLVFQEQRRCARHARRMEDWGKLTKQWLENLDNVPRDRLKLLFDAWYESFIADYTSWSTMRRYTDEIRWTYAGTIFAEMSRTYFVLEYPAICAETAEMARVGKECPELRIRWTLGERLADMAGPVLQSGVNWTRPIMMFTQKEIMAALLMLTEKLDQANHACIPDIERAVRVLFLRNSVFFCEESDTSILDAPNFVHNGCMPNRDYYMFSAMYFNAVQRRVFYWEAANKEKIAAIDAASTLRCKRWVEDEVCALDAETFDEVYQKSYDEAFCFPGDAEWFRYRYPRQKAYPGSLVDCFRKEFSAKYDAQYRVSLEAVMAAVGQSSHSGHCAHLFVLNCLDQYLRNHYSLPAWRDGLVLKNEDMEGATAELMRGEAPYLVQLFSRYCVYFEDTFYYSDCIYETLAFWLTCVHRGYKNRVFDISIEPLIRKILYNEQKKSFPTAF